MPGRDGRGPLGQGSRTGRGLGNCTTPGAAEEQSQFPNSPKPATWGGRLWDATVGQIAHRRRSRRNNRQ